MSSKRSSLLFPSFPLTTSMPSGLARFFSRLFFGRTTSISLSSFDSDTKPTKKSFPSTLFYTLLSDPSIVLSVKLLPLHRQNLALPDPSPPDSSSSLALSSTSVFTYDPNDSTSPPDTKTWKVVGSKVYPLRSREGRVPVPGSEDDASRSGCEGGTGTEVVYFECQELEEVFENLLKKAQGGGAKSLLELKRSPTQLVNVAS